MESNLKNIIQVLQEIKSIKNIFGTTLISNNGILIASTLPENVDHRHFAAMAATMVGAIQTAAQTIGSNVVEGVNVLLDHNNLYCKRCNPDSILVVVYDKDSSLDDNLLQEPVKKIELYLK